MVKPKVRGLALLRISWLLESSMSTKQRVNGPKRRGQTVKAQSAAGLAEVARATSRLWRKHHLSYDQTKYVVERARRALGVEPPRTRRRTVQRLDYPEVERLIRSAYREPRFPLNKKAVPGVWRRLSSRQKPSIRKACASTSP
jgi:hypothetical protein